MGEDSVKETGRRPVVLLAATCLWSCTPKLAILLSRLGCDVVGVAPKSHLLHRTGALSACFTYRARGPVKNLTTIIERTAPDLIIPCDERAVFHLHRLHERTRDQATKTLIERSLGAPSAFATVEARHDLLQLAIKNGVAVPDTREIESLADLDDWAKTQPLPWVLKADGSWGGEGVRIVSTRAEAERAFRSLTKKIHPIFALRQVILRQNLFVLTPWLHGPARRISVQRYVEGRPANCAMAAWNGEVLGGIAVKVLCSDGATGPASVISLAGDPQMLEAGARIIAALGVTGLVGFDFVIEAGTGKAWLLEMNPRTTPIAHLQPGPGRDLVAPFISKLVGKPVSAATVIGETVALYPQALFVRDDHAHLEGAYLGRAAGKIRFWRA